MSKMPFVIVTSKAYRSTHVVEGLCNREVHQLMRYLNRVFWDPPDLVAPNKVEFRGHPKTHPAIDLTNALEQLGFRLVSVVTYPGDPKLHGHSVVVFTYHRSPGQDEGGNSVPRYGRGSVESLPLCMHNARDSLPSPY